MKKRTLGEILLEMKVIDQLQLNAALAHHRQWGVPLGKALIEKRLCGKDAVFNALSRQTGLPTVRLEGIALSPTQGSLLPLKVAQQHKVVPLRLEGKRSETLVVAIAAPASLSSLDAVQSASGKQRVIAHLATDEDIALALHLIYGLEKPQVANAPPPFAPARVNDEHEVDFTAAPKRPETEVLLYGWPQLPAEALKSVLIASGMTARIISDDELTEGRSADVVLAPLPSIEAAVQRGAKVASRLVVAGKEPDQDFPRAQAVGASGFLPAPVEAELVLHVLKRLTRKAA